MFNKNDPLIESVKAVMQQSDAERAATETVNEAFGIVDRKALPHELQPLWEEAYKAVLNEDVEALNELSRKKLAKYAGDAADDLADKTDPNYAYMADIDQDTLERETENRRKGIRRAAKKLAREDVERIVAEALKGNQHKIDANKNGRVDGHDFKLLRAGKKQMEEQSVLPKNLGPGSGFAGQHSVGNKTVRSQSPQEFMNKTKTYQGMSDATKKPLDTTLRPGATKSTVATPIMDKAVADKTKADIAARQSLADKARAGRVADPKGSFIASARAEKARAKAAGEDGTKYLPGPDRQKAERQTALSASAAERKAMEGRPQTLSPGANNSDLKMPAAADKVKLQGGKVVPGNTPKDTGGDLARDAAKNATPAKVDQDLTKNQSWSQKVGSAMRAHIAKGGKHGDTIDVDGKKIKVSWKDKQYQSNLIKKYSKSSADKAKRV